ncbi:hypothetical protein [Ralstonia phage RP13]|nr:hypothetical protein [Ralstonia phage RP13]
MKNMNMSKMIQQLMGHQISQVDNLVWDLATGQIGVKSRNGITTISANAVTTSAKTKTTAPNADEQFGLVCNPIEHFSMAIPAFAIATPFDQLKVQDIVVDADNRAVGWITKINAKTLRVLKTDGTNTTWTPPKVQIMGMPAGGVKVVKQLINVDGGLQNLQTSLMPMMLASQMMGDEGEDDTIGQMMQMQLFMQMTGQQSNNQMGGMMNMLPMMMLMKKGF